MYLRLLGKIAKVLETAIPRKKITYSKETDGKYLGYLNDYPDHCTQGVNLEDLKEHLLDLYKEFSKSDLPGIKKREQIEVG